MENNELPTGWVWTRLGEISNNITKGSTPTSYGYSYKKEGIKFIKTENIIENGTIENVTDFIDQETNLFLKRSVLQPNDILFSIAGTIGRVGIVQEKHLPANTNQALSIIRCPWSFIDNKYISNFLKSPFIQRQALKSIVGVGRANISLTNLGDFLIPLPSLPEQRRIVTKLEELFTRLDAGVSELKKTQAQLKRYRQSVLKAACEGKLVPTEAELAKAEGREYETADVLLARILKERREKAIKGAKYKKLELPDISGLLELPEGWMWVTSRILSWYVTSGSRDWKKYYSNSGAIFIRTQDINKNELSLDNVAFVALPEKVEGKRSIVQKNDILIIITGANVGKVALVERDIDEAYVSQSVALMKLVLTDMGKYIHFALIADGFGKTELDKMVYGMGRPVLSLENVQDINLPLPPLAEQRRIVAEVERRLSIADGVEKTVAQSLAQAQRLRQSILKKAFEGRLVAQDASDEPAGVLLERIKQEKEQMGEKKRKR